MVNKITSFFIHVYQFCNENICYYSFLDYASYKCSNSSFLFSLRNEKNLPAFRCPIIEQKKDKAICCTPSRGPGFGGDYGADLLISDNANASQSSLSNLGYTYQSPPGYQPWAAETKALLAGSYRFTPSEIEVFRI